MLVQKVKLTVVGEPVAYPKKENGMIVMDPETGLAVTGGYRRQVVFESLDYRKDSIPITLFNEEMSNFNFAAGTEGELQFICESREPNNNQEGEKRYYAEFRLINFIPSN